MKLSDRIWGVIHWMGMLATNPIFFAATNLVVAVALLWEHLAPIALRFSDGAFDVALSWFTLVLDQIIILVQWRLQVQAKADRDADRKILEDLHKHLVSIETEVVA